MVRFLCDDVINKRRLLRCELLDNTWACPTVLEFISLSGLKVRFPKVDCLVEVEWL